ARSIALRSTIFRARAWARTLGRRMRRTYVFAWLGPLILLPGCLPIVESYYRLEREGATYFGGSCRGSVGPPSIAYFPYEGVYLSAAVGEVPKMVLIGIHVPSGQTLQLREKSISISYEPPRETSTRQIDLKPARRRGGTPDPYEFQEIPDPYGKE